MPVLRSVPLLAALALAGCITTCPAPTAAVAPSAPARAASGIRSERPSAAPRAAAVPVASAPVTHAPTGAEADARVVRPVLRTYVRGPRGGCYYVTASGRKAYVDRERCGPPPGPTPPPDGGAPRR